MTVPPAARGICYTLHPLVVTGSSPIYTGHALLSINEMVIPVGRACFGRFLNSAAIPLPADLLELYQTVELHCSFDAIGRLFDAEKNPPCSQGHMTPG